MHTGTLSFTKLRLTAVSVIYFSLVAIMVFAMYGNASAAFPGVNGKIVYISTKDGNAEVYTMGPDGTNKTRLTNNTDAESHPQFSPDGSKIVYVSYMTATNSAHIMMMNADGSNKKDITPALNVVDTPKFSPNGREIVFSGGPNGENGIYTMSLNGKQLHAVITSTQSVLTDPTYLPNGNQVVFRGDPFVSGYSDIFKVNTDGTGLTNLTNSPTNSEEFTDVSPDGTQIIFGRFENLSDNIYVMNADGSNQTFLVAGLYPHFSPDGTKFVYSASNSGQFDVYTSDLNQPSVSTRLTVESPRNEQASWGVGL